MIAHAVWSDAIEVADLYVHYATLTGERSQVLAEINLRVPAGQSVAVVGHNGVGKTSLICALAGAVPTACGTIRLQGWNLATHRAHALLGVHLIDEAPPCCSSRTVEQTFDPDGHSSVPAAQLLHMLGLWERRAVPLAHLAPHHQRAAAIGQALIADPRILLLDEPTLGLAPAVADRVLAALRAATLRGTTMLIATSQLDLALQVCQRLIVLDGGRLVLDVPTAVVQRLLTRQWYDIRVLGHLGAGWAEWLDGLRVEPEPGGAMLLSGTLPDQAALLGLLIRIGNLGLTILEVRSITPDPSRVYADLTAQMMAIQ